MLKLIIGNKAYSSWSQRGWLACKQSGLPFDEQVVPMWSPEWDALKSGVLAQSAGKVPSLFDGEIFVWDSMAIVMYLSEKSGADKFWPAEPQARATAMSYCAEMHSSYQTLRNECSSNYRKTYSAEPMSEGLAADVARITHLWEAARATHGKGGDFLFGAFGAADIMFAPVVGRFLTYALPITPVVKAYLDAVRAQPFVADWYAAAHAEPWVIDKYER